MPTIDQQIRDAKKQSRQLRRALATEKHDLARLADADRQLHAERDRKTNELPKAGKGEHHDAIEQVVKILDADIHEVRGRLHDTREMRKKNRDRLKVVRHRLTHLQHKKHHHHHGGVISGDGPDVSVYQGSVNWNAVATKCDFAIAKASEGVTYRDPTWSKARADAMKVLKARGAYHFAHPSNAADAEVSNFVGAVEGAGTNFISYDAFTSGRAGFVGCLDFEAAPYSESWAREWGQKFHDVTGVKALIYGGGYSLNPVLGALDAFDGVWIAGYPNYVWSGPDALIVLHQFTSSGSIPGVGGACDVSHYLGG